MATENNKNESSPDPDGKDRLNTPEELFRKFLSRNESNDPVTEEEFLSRYPDLENELRRLFENFRSGAQDEIDLAPAGETGRSGKDDVRILGDFRIIREIGRGGQGVVYEAEQISLRRTVALKVLPAHLTLQMEAIRRFDREATTTARLRHPGIVEIYAVGEADGNHFFAMEFVEGTPLDKVIGHIRTEDRQEISGIHVGATVSTSAHRKTLEDSASHDDEDHPTPTPSKAWNRTYIETACRILSQVADALEHAHRAGVIHRDVKPSNILVHDDMTAVLTDFGLARTEGFPSITFTGDFAGTPYYVSPEQAMARRVKVDHRTDIYSLGVTLYELLTFRRPFEGKSSQEVLGKIIAKEPPLLRKVNPLIPRDLETICLTAMEKDPDRRYQSAGELGADLERFLDFRPVKARPVGLATRTLRMIRRNPLQATAIVLGLLVVVVWPLAFGLQQQALRKAVQAEQKKTEESNRRVKESNQNLTRAHEELKIVNADLNRELQKARIRLLISKSEEYRSKDREISLLLALEAAEKSPGLETTNLVLEALTKPRKMILKHQVPGQVVHSQFSPDCDSVLTVQKSGLSSVWNVLNGAHRFDLTVGREEFEELIVRYGCGGTMLVALWRPSGASSVIVDRFDAETGRAVSSIRIPHGTRHSVAREITERDCARLVSIPGSNEIAVWDAASGKMIKTWTSDFNGLRSALLSPNGLSVAAETQGGVLFLFDVETGKEIVSFKGRTDTRNRALFSPDSQRIAATTRNNALCVYDARTGAVVKRLKGYETGLSALVYSPMGSWLATVDPEDALRLWNTLTWKEIPLPDTLPSRISGVDFSPDEGTMLLRLPGQNGMILWDIASRRIAKNLLGHTGEVTSALFSRDARYAVSASKDGTARLWFVDRWKTGSVTLEDAPAGSVQAEFSPDRERLVTVSDRLNARLWDAATGRLIASLNHLNERVNLIEFSDRTDYLLTATEKNSVRIWDGRTGGLIHELKGHSKRVTAASFSPDDRSVVTTSADKTSRIWSVETGKSLQILEQHRLDVASADFSPGGDFVLTGSKDGTACVWYAENGEKRIVLEGHRRGIRGCAFSPNGRYAATYAAVVMPEKDLESCCFLWDPATGKKRALDVPENAIRSMAFSPDSRTVAAGTDSGLLLLWDTSTGRRLARSHHHEGAVLSIAFSRDGSLLLTLSEDKSLRVWNPVTLENSVHWGDFVCAAFGDDDTRVLAVSRENKIFVYNAVCGGCSAVLNSGDDFLKTYYPALGKSMKNRNIQRFIGESKDGSKMGLVKKDSDNICMIYDCGARFHMATLRGHFSRINSIRFSRDSLQVVTASNDNTARLWNWKGESLLRILVGHREAVRFADFSPDGTMVVTASDDYTARLWNVSDGETIGTLDGHDGTVRHATFCPEGRYVLTASDDGTARLWDARSCEPQITLSGHGGKVVHGAFSRDGSRIVTSSDDGTARIWAWPGGIELATLVGGDGPVDFASFTSDGMKIITRSFNGMIRTWPADPLLAARRMATRELSEDEKILFDLVP